MSGSPIPKLAILHKASFAPMLVMTSGDGQTCLPRFFGRTKLADFSRKLLGSGTKHGKMFWEWKLWPKKKLLARNEKDEWEKG